MKKFSFLALVMLLLSFNLARAQEFQQNLSVEIVPGSGCPIEIAPGSFVRAIFEGGSSCPSGGVSLDFNASHFGFVPTNGQNITIEPENTWYSWVSITNNSGPIPYPAYPTQDVMTWLTTGTHTIYPNEGAVEMTLRFNVAYKDEYGIDLACPLDVKVKGLNYNCFCKDITSVTAVITNFYCDYDDCTGQPLFDYTVSLQFSPSAPPNNTIFVNWYINDILSGQGTGMTSFQINDAIFSDKVHAKITYLGACAYVTEPIWLQTDGFPVGTCVGTAGLRVKLTSSLQGCVTTPQGVSCTYLLSAVPAVTTPVVAVSGVQWSVNGNNIGTGQSITYTTVPGASSTNVSASITGTSNGKNCNWNLQKSLPCGIAQCGQPCGFADDIFIKKTLLGCDESCCNYQFSIGDPTDPNIYDYIDEIYWTIDGVVYTENSPTVCIGKYDYANVSVGIYFNTGCGKSLSTKVFCDDYVCGECTVEAELKCIGRVFYGTQGARCKYEFSVEGCQKANVTVPGVYEWTHTFSVCDASGCIVQVGPAVYLGYYNTVFYAVPGHVYEVKHEIFFNGALIHSWTGEAGCTDGASCDQWGERENLGTSEETEINILDNKILIHPNPTSSDMTVTVTEDIGTGATMYLYDVDGRLRMEKPLPSTPGEFKFDVSELPEGIYLVKIKSDTTELKVQKLSIARN